MNLTCCLCMFVAPNESALEQHIDLDHAEIFRSIKPFDYTVGNSDLGPAFGQNSNKSLAATSPQVFFNSPAHMPTFSQFNGSAEINNSVAKVPAKRGRKPKNSMAAPELFVPVVAPVKAQRGRKPTVSGLSVSLPLVGTPAAAAPVKPTWTMRQVQTASPPTTTTAPTPVETARDENLTTKKRRSSTMSTSRNGKRKSTENEAGMPSFEPKDEPGFEPTEFKSETPTLPPSQSSILTTDQTQQFLEIQLQVLRAENEDLKKKLEGKTKAELNLANEVVNLKTELSRQVMAMSSFDDEKRNFEQLTSELVELKSSSVSDIQRLKSELEESSAANLELESRLISLSEKCTDMETSQQTYDTEVSQLRSEVELSRAQVEGLQDIIRKKNALVSQMKLNEERYDLELKKLKKFETDFKGGSDRFNLIKSGLIQLFERDESFCSDVIGRDAFKDIDGDDEICEIVEHIFTDYVSSKKKHLEDLQFYNKKIRDLKALMQQKDQRFCDLTCKFNSKIDEVRCRMADVKKLATKLEIVNAEKTKVDKKLEVSLGELERAKSKQAEFENGTRQLLRDLKLSIDKKNEMIDDLQKELAKPVKVDPRLVEKHVQKIGQLQLIEGHLKKKLAESKFQSSKLLSMVDVLQKLVFVTDQKASSVKKLVKENDQLKKEAGFQNERFGTMIKNVQEMREKVKTTMARNDAEIKQLNLELKNKDSLCNLLKKELECRNKTSN